MHFRAFIVIIFTLISSLNGFSQVLGKKTILLDSTDLKRYRNSIFKQNLKISSEQSYLSPPQLEQHIGKFSTYKNYVVNYNPNVSYFFFSDSKSRFNMNIFMNTNVRINKNVSDSPRFGQKVFWDLDYPVRTPSYIPGIIFNLGNGINNPSSKSSKEIQKLLLRSTDQDFNYAYKYFSIKIYHHSNGQDGFHDENTQLANMDKAINMISNDERYTRFKKDIIKVDKNTYVRDINVYNGNFSNNLMGNFGVTFSNYVLGGNYIPSYNKDDNRVYFNKDRIRNLYFGLETKVWKSLGEPTLEGKQVLTKLMFRGQWIKASKWLSEEEKTKKEDPNVFEKNRFILNASFGVNNLSSDYEYLKHWYNRFNIDARYHFNVFSNKVRINSENVSPFVGVGWKGQDDYNIYFQDRFLYINAGLAMGFKIHKDNRLLKTMDEIQQKKLRK